MAVLEVLLQTLLGEMALNMSDDEDIDFRRQRFQHPDDVDDMDMNSDSDGEPEQVLYHQESLRVN